MHGWRVHTYKDGAPSLICNLSSSSLHLKRTKIVNSAICKRWLVGRQPNLLQFCHFLSHLRCHSFLARYAPPSNLSHRCSSSRVNSVQDGSDLMIPWQDHRAHSIRRYGRSWNSTTDSQYTVIHDCWFKLYKMAWRLNLSPSFEILYFLRKDALLYQLDNFSFRFLNFFVTDMPCDLACVCLFFLLSWGPLDPL